MNSPLILDKALANLLLGWCEGTFEDSKFDTRKPKIRLYKATKDYYGIYNSRSCSITLYMGAIEATADPLITFVETIIHEYIHYLQPIDECYNILNNHFGGYGANPLEHEADRVAKTYTSKALVFLIDSLSKS